MVLSFSKGRKSPNDVIVFINGKQVKFVEITEAVIQFWKNEEERYPTYKGFDGGRMILNFIEEACHRGIVTDEMLTRYKLTR